MSSKSIPNVSELFQNAHSEGILSSASLRTLEDIDIGAQIQAGLGVSVDRVKASEVVLVTMLIDDSGSIRFGKNTQIVRDGHNAVLDALMASKQSGNILAHTCYLNGFILFPFLPLGVIDDDEQRKSGKIKYAMNPQVIRMDRTNYDPNLGTPLYDQTVVVLGRVLAKYQEFAEAGVVARSVTLLITDGADESSVKATSKTVKSIVTDLLGEKNIVAAMGIDDGGRTDFRYVFREMGIHNEWILTPQNSPSEIRKAFQVFSQSAVRVSQAAANFSQSSVGGFLSP